MKSEKIKEIFDKMVSATVDAKEDLVLDLYQILKNNGYDFSVKSTEQTDWQEIAGIKYATVRQEAELYMGPARLCAWSGRYVGF